MKREPRVTLAEIACDIRHVDLTPLEGKLIGKQIVALEHCLIEVLGSLSEDFRLSRSCIADAYQFAAEATDRTTFMSAYNDYLRERGSQARKVANFSPLGRYFQTLFVRLQQREEEQIGNGKTVTVDHARLLAGLVLRQLETMAFFYLGRSEKLDKLWDAWMSPNTNKVCA